MAERYRKTSHVIYWARGYFAATVGNVTDDLIREYVSHQGEKPDQEDFKIVNP